MTQGFDAADTDDELEDFDGGAAGWAPGTVLEGYVGSIDGDVVDSVFVRERDGPRWYVTFPRSCLPEAQRDAIRLGTYLDATFTGDDLDISVKDVGVWTEGDLARAKSEGQQLAELLEFFKEDDWDEGRQAAR
jgi:hypothetical protein